MMIVVWSCRHVGSRHPVPGTTHTCPRASRSDWVLPAAGYFSYSGKYSNKFTLKYPNPTDAICHDDKLIIIWGKSYGYGTDTVRLYTTVLRNSGTSYSSGTVHHDITIHTRKTTVAKSLISFPQQKRRYHRMHFEWRINRLTGLQLTRFPKHQSKQCNEWMDSNHP